MPVNRKNIQSGFTLMEMVIGITVFAIALTVATAVIAPQINKTIDPIYQVRATELAQSMFNEILGKYYDENSDRNGGRIRCDEDLNNNGNDSDTGLGEISCSLTMGPDAGESGRDSFDDVDDYHGYTRSDDIENSLGQDLVLSGGKKLYQGFSVAVAVNYDDDQDAIANSLESPQHPDTGNIKLVQVTVTTPAGDELTFSSFKHNY